MARHRIVLRGGTVLTMDPHLAARVGARMAVSAADEHQGLIHGMDAHDPDYRSDGG